MTTTPNFDPETYLRLIQLLLMGLEDMLSAEGLYENTRTAALGKRLQSYRDKVARVRSALAKHQDAENRRRELEKDNRRRNPLR
jgi:phage-related minor tail protein